MKVAVVHNLPPGGAWRRLRNQVLNLDAEVAEVCLETATPVTDNPRIVPLRPFSQRLPRSLRPPARYFDLLALEVAWGRASRAIRALRPDVIYLNPCRYLQAPPIGVAQLPPTVYFCDEPRRVDHEPEASAERSGLTRPLYQPIYLRERQLDQRTARAVDVIATNSRYTAGAIMRAYGRSANVLRMGVAASLQEEHSLAPSHDFVLSVGTLIPSKGHDLVIRAAAECATRRQVKIVAPRPALEYANDLEKLARSLGVLVDIRIGVSDAELGGLYRTAFATLYLARREPLGLVSLEAQAEGCPVIVADEGGLPETIEEGVSGWSCPRDASAAATLLDRWADEGLRSRMARAAKANAETWTWQASAAGLSELLRRAQYDGASFSAREAADSD